jgi:MFS family permease
MSRRDAAPALLALMAWWGYAAGVNGAIAPHVAARFALSDAALAAALAWIGLASLGALALGRLADRLGRRRLALGAAGVLPLAAAASACAPTLAAYVAAQLVTWAAGATLLATTVVMVAEHAPPGGRARAQGRAGIAFTLGTALPLLVSAALAPGGEHPEAWRRVWWLAAAPLPLLPWLARRLPETRPWLRSAADAPRGGREALLRTPHARRVRVILATATLVAVVEVATRVWLFHHAVRGLGLAPQRAFLVIAAGGVAGLVGFPAGAWLAERIGRRATFAFGSTLFAVGALAWFAPAPPTGPPALLGLTAGFMCLALGANAATTAFRALATEQVPTRVRGELGGWLAGVNAVGWLVAMLGASALAARLGSIGLAVSALSLLVVPAVALVMLGLRECSELDGIDAPARHPSLAA